MTAENPWRARLRHLEQIFPRSPIYFVTACTHNRQKLLATPTFHDAFVSFARNGANHGAWIGADVLMPDHLHLFVAIDDEQIELAGWVKSLKNALSRTLQISAILPPHWQKGFFDHLLRRADSYEQKWQYVCENPVRGGLAKSAGDWPFSGEINDLRYHDAQ